VLPDERETRAPQHHQRDDEIEELLAAHAGCNLRRLARASASPASATSSGTSPMLTTLVQNSSVSVSTRRFFLSCLSASRASAAFVRKLSSSACCSDVRMELVTPAFDFWSFCRFSCVWLRLS